MRWMFKELEYSGGGCTRGPRTAESDMGLRISKSASRKGVLALDGFARTAPALSAQPAADSGKP